MENIFSAFYMLCLFCNRFFDLRFSKNASICTVFPSPISSARQAHRRPGTGRNTKGNTPHTEDKRGRPSRITLSQDYRFVSAMKKLADRLHIGK